MDIDINNVEGEDGMPLEFSARGERGNVHMSVRFGETTVRFAASPIKFRALLAIIEAAIAAAEKQMPS